MTLLPALVALWMAANPAVEDARSYMAEGDFTSALRVLEGALAETSNQADAAQLHLTRGEVLGAQQRFDAVKEAFTRALSEDPEARLDPERVHPRLLTMLEELRQQLRGVLVVQAPPGTRVLVDRQPASALPGRLDLPIGRHLLAITLPDGPTKQAEALIRVGERTEVSAEDPRLVTGTTVSPGLEQVADRPPPERPGRVGAEARAVVDLARAGGFELGAFWRHRPWAVSVSGVIGRVPGATVRLSIQLLDLWHGLGAHASADGVLFFAGGVVPGGGASVGASWRFGVVEPLAEVSVRQFAATSRFRSTYVLVTLGARVAFASF